MRTSGYTAERAANHDAIAIPAVRDELDGRGYVPRLLPVDGHRPDMQLYDDSYVDVKTGHPNLAIEVDDLTTWRRIAVAERRRVYIVHVRYVDQGPDTWRVHTVDSLRVKGGPRRPSGNGSNDDWYLCDPDGTPFNDFFGRLWS